jgi:hypothetical protein
MVHRLSEQFAAKGKWASTHPNLRPGMVVVIKESNHPLQDWKMAVVEEIHPGCDGLVRVATIKTTTGSTKRPIHKLVILPTEG